MIQQVNVTSLGGLGDGIASLNGKPVFIAKSCPGDRLDITIVHENRERMQGVINRIVEPGSVRQSAPCRYFERCGGCTLQQLIPDTYREFKTRMLHKALERAGFAHNNPEVVFLPPHSRRRVEFKVKHEGYNVALAFHDLRSHNATVIEECLLLVPKLQALIAPLNRHLSQQSFSAALYSVGLTAADKGIDLLLTFKNFLLDTLPPLEALAKDLGIARIAVRTPDTKATVVADIAPVEMQLGEYAVALPPESFLQATSEGQNALTRIALDAVQSASSVVDLFCGIGSYSFPLSQQSKVHAIELDAAMVQTVSVGAKCHTIKNLSAVQRDLFKQPLSAQELSGFSAVVINPPRLGAKAQTQALAASRVNNITMISCNPATFSRDALILKQAGFSLESICAIDQFLWSPHLEIAAVFKR